MRVAVVGGGLAGLTAALELVDAGVDVPVHEARPTLGGAVQTLPAREGDPEPPPDNGQHIALGCFTEYLRFLDRIGEGGSYLRTRLALPVLAEDGTRSDIKPSLPGLLSYAHVPLRDRLRIPVVTARWPGGEPRPRPARLAELREQGDVIRMLDWLETTKQPLWIGAVGNSMGAATVLGAAVADQRIRALILDSMHADIVTSVGNALEEDFGYPGGPAALALMTGVSIRIGGDVTAIDPIRLIGRLGDRPVLLIQGTVDQVDPPAEASDRNFQAALAAGVPAELAYCPGARHGLTVKTCPSQWASWATSFLELARKP